MRIPSSKEDEERKMPPTTAVFKRAQ